MFNLKQSICHAGFGARANEDAVGYGKDYCFVIDGASCLSGKNVVDPISDAAWMAKNVRDSLCALLDKGDSRSTKELLREVISPLRDKYVDTLQKQGIGAPTDSPSACFALFRKRADKLEFFGLGDCVGVAKLPNGEDFWSLDENLTALDKQVLDRMRIMHEQTGLSIIKAKKLCNDMLIYNRNLRNKQGGYWILDMLSDIGINNAEEKSWDLTDPICVGAFSDGFAQLTEVFGVYESYTKLFEAMQKNNLEEMFARLCALQDADADCNDYPRFKLRDDTCALWGIFTP
mgnify:CR=1 FL=1